jgi:hypothetical protein
VTLLKVRFLLAMRKYEGSTVMHKIGIRSGSQHAERSGRLPAEIVHQIRSELREGTLVGNPNNRDPARLIQDLISQIDELYQMIDKKMGYYLATIIMVDTSQALETPPNMYNPDMPEHTQRLMEYDLGVWQENPEVLSYLRGRPGVWQDSQDVVRLLLEKATLEEAAERGEMS